MDDHLEALTDELRDIVKEKHPDPERAIQELIGSDDPTIEDDLWKLGTPPKRGEPNLWPVGIHTLALRMLVERDRDRDPTPFLELNAPRRPRKANRSRLSKLLDRVFDMPPILDGLADVSRLRQVDHVGECTRVLEQDRRRFARMFATGHLGVCDDLAALTPLSAALADRSYLVRLGASNAIRRLRLAGADAVFATHPVRAALVRALDDPKQRVRVAAAWTLADYGDLEPIRQRRARSRRDRRRLDLVLAGDVPPLTKTWAGDTTV